MISKNTLILIAVVIIPFAIFGCRHSTLEKHWGDSQELARNSQIANPDASRNMEPVEGFDGLAANEAMKSYQQGGIEDKKKETTYNLRLGNIEGIGSKKKKY